MILATVHEAFLFPDAALQPSDLSIPLGMKSPRWRPITAGHGRPCHLRQLVRSSRVPMAQTGRGGKSQHANCRHQISLTRFPTYTNHKYLGAVLLGVRHEAAAHAPSIVDATDVSARLLAGRWENQPVLYGPNIYCISALSDFLFFHLHDLAAGIWIYSDVSFSIEWAPCLMLSPPVLSAHLGGCNSKRVRCPCVAAHKAHLATAAGKTSSKCGSKFPGGWSVSPAT
ncbi:uncharacterized protein IWZ02DRAFT_294917 [Phyllosticta citriasiana]|uniref:uncharacterized protein n=1 Tax=Phyllosticta citriasiana TaxID=595635 RepID=UPI0030FD5B2D